MEKSIRINDTETILNLLSCGHREFEWNESYQSSPSGHHNVLGIRFWHYFFSNIYRTIVLPFAVGFGFGFMCILVFRLESESTMKLSVEIGRSRVAWQRTGSEGSDSVTFYAGPVELSPVEYGPVASASIRTTRGRTQSIAALRKPSHIQAPYSHQTAQLFRSSQFMSFRSPFGGTGETK
ncbi:hypothetical protein M427DRAFT_497298 [Gonapodya prolifera JEL478]|uniref:Uncharacterized protein n=1 Tax=Gonapodya prolifera (strain JEL478) TaxID=1344416 RepID=A0A139AG75_GONPJ|nr:hypothetical protein M427DRAFT_497298 [Gonapodya prolifera JEL478]|eukprot:KXS15413.1 hypothetical protein M427DRAFT_497298 [Gonapodya prolifera JEL478]